VAHGSSFFFSHQRRHRLFSLLFHTAMFTASHVSRTLALRPDGPTHDANLEGEKEVEKAVPR